MPTRYYTVARHTFAVTLPEGEKGIALPSYEPFAVPSGTDKLLFSLTVDDTFYPDEKGETIGEFDCGAADFGVYRLADGTYQILISPPGGKYCGLLQANGDFSQAIIATRGEDSMRTFANAEEVKAALVAERPEGRTILIKGSNSMKLASLVEWL